jgi:uncharacterized protein HemX
MFERTQQAGKGRHADLFPGPPAESLPSAQIFDPPAAGRRQAFDETHDREHRHGRRQGFWMGSALFGMVMLLLGIGLGAGGALVIQSQTYEQVADQMASVVGQGVAIGTAKAEREERRAKAEAEAWEKAKQNPPPVTPAGE